MNTSDQLPSSFFDRDPHHVAIDLLGRDLNLRRSPQSPPHLSGRIVEVEVYGGREDLASHANSNTPTTRTKPMFGPPGNCYVYIIYGMYCCLNVATKAGSRPSAILIRALEPGLGTQEMTTKRQARGGLKNLSQATLLRALCSGPGKLCDAFGIDTSFNDIAMGERHALLYFSHGKPLVGDPERRLISGPRIGLNKETCKEATDWCWRYGDGDSKFISRRF